MTGDIAFTTSNDRHDAVRRVIVTDAGLADSRRGCAVLEREQRGTRVIPEPLSIFFHPSSLSHPDERGRGARPISSRPESAIETSHTNRHESAIIPQTGGQMKRSGPIKRRTPLKRSSGLKAKRQGLSSDVRSRVFLRDGGCRGRALIPDLSCMGKLDPHHIILKSQGGQDTPDNLVTLCRAHHDWVHAHPESSRNLGLLKRPQPKETTNDNDQ